MQPPTYPVRLSLVAVVTVVADVALLALAAVLATDLPAQTSRPESGGLPPWNSVAEAPAWVAKPPARAGFLRFVTHGRSNLEQIAKRGAMQPNVRGVRRALAERLPRLLDDQQTERIAVAAHRLRKAVQCAYSFRVLTRRAVPGNTLAEAWTLWEVPVPALLAALPAGDRATVARVLGADARKPAKNMLIAPNWVRRSAVRASDAKPPEFTLDCTVEMPTPGWRLQVDKVTDPDATGRIRAFVTGTPPKGAAATVMTDEKLALPLGARAVGRYLVEVWFRRGKGGEYERRGVALLEARGG